MTIETLAGGISIKGPQDPSEDMKEIVLKRALVILIVVSLFAFTLLPLESAAGFLAGGIISLLNFRDLKRSLETFFAGLQSGKRMGEAGLVARYYLKLGLTLVVLAALIKSGRVGIPGLLLGLFLVPGTIIFTGIKLYIGSFGGKR